jgi:hypothetical protein
LLTSVVPPTSTNNTFVPDDKPWSLAVTTIGSALEILDILATGIELIYPILCNALSPIAILFDILVPEPNAFLPIAISLYAVLNPDNAS